MNPNFNEKSVLKINPTSSWEAKFADELRQDIESGKIDTTTDEATTEALLKKFKRHPKLKDVSLSEVITILKKSGVIKPVVIEKTKEARKEPEREFLAINIPQNNLRIVQDEGLNSIAKTNIDLIEKRKQIDFILKNKEIIGKLDKKSKEVLESDSDGIEFAKAGIISDKEFNEDKEKIKQRKIIFEDIMTLEEKETKIISTIFEAIVVYGINLSKCFGENVKVRPSNPHDDIFRNIDLFINFKNNENENDIALGLDVKMGSIEGENFTEKVEGVLCDIKNNNKKKIKYFKNFDGKLKKNVFAPRIIISCELSMVKELMFDFENLPRDEFSAKLKSHRMSREIVSQVVGQCNLFARYAEDNKQKDMAEFYHNVLKTVYDIAEESIILKRLLVGAGSDSVSKKIKEIIDEYKYKETKKQAEKAA